MSHDTATPSTMQHPHPHSPPPSSAPEHDNFNDFFADVSQHGASLFELFALPNASLPLPSSPSQSNRSPPPHSPPPPPQSVSDLAPATSFAHTIPSASPPSHHHYHHHHHQHPPPPQATAAAAAAPPPPPPPPPPAARRPHQFPSTSDPNNPSSSITLQDHSLAVSPHPPHAPKQRPPPRNTSTTTKHPTFQTALTNNHISTTAAAAAAAAVATAAAEAATRPSGSLPPTPTISKRASITKRRPARSPPTLNDSYAVSGSSDDAAPSSSPKLPTSTATSAPPSQHRHHSNNNSNKNNNNNNQQQHTNSIHGPTTTTHTHTAGESSHSLDMHHPVPKHTHNSHTRRCRAKVNNKFQELLRILPAPPPKTGIKHKAQILDYTIRVFRDIHARKTQLEAELALSSRAHLNTWVTDIVARSVSLHDILAPFLSLICTKGKWKYSEAWVSAHEPPSRPDILATSIEGASADSPVATNLSNILIGPQSRLRLGLAVIPSLGNTDDPDLQLKLERFRDRSRPYGCRARVDLPGRIMCTMRPEWLPSLCDQEAFQRSRLASDASLAVCFGIPVFIRGQVAAVAMFFDTEQRPYDAKCIDLADKVASLLGNTFAASAFRRAQCR